MANNDLLISTFLVAAGEFSIYWRNNASANSYKIYISKTENGVYSYLKKEYNTLPAKLNGSITSLVKRSDYSLDMGDYWVKITRITDSGESILSDSPATLITVPLYPDTDDGGSVDPALEGRVATLEAEMVVVQGDITTIQGDITTLQTDLTNHLADFSNPHHVTATQIGAEPGYFEFVAGENLAAGLMVRISAANTVLRADHSAIATCRSTIGMTIQTKAIGETIRVIENDEYDFGAAVLTAGATYYLSNNGTITDDISAFVAGEIVLEVGKAKTTSIFIVTVKDPIILS